MEEAAEYITVFEIPSKWTNYFIVPSVLCTIVGLALCAILTIYTLNNWKSWQTDKKLRKQAVFAIFFLLIWGLVWAFGTWATIDNIKIGKELIEAYYSGNYEIVEGVVKVLYQEPRFGHAPSERLRINETEIKFSYFSDTPAYHQTISHGGILKDGVYAKLYLYKRSILRIDIPESNNSRFKGL